MRVMRQLDDAGRDYEAMIAEDVAARAGKPAAATASRRARGRSRTSAAKCGTRNDADAEFCKKCGGKLVREAS